MNKRNNIEEENKNMNFDISYDLDNYKTDYKNKGYPYTAKRTKIQLNTSPKNLKLNNNYINSQNFYNKDNSKKNLNNNITDNNNYYKNHIISNKNNLKRKSLPLNFNINNNNKKKLLEIRKKFDKLEDKINNLQYELIIKEQSKSSNKNNIISSIEKENKNYFYHPIFQNKEYNFQSYNPKWKNLNEIHYRMQNANPQSSLLKKITSYRTSHNDESNNISTNLNKNIVYNTIVNNNHYYSQLTNHNQNKSNNNIINNNIYNNNNLSNNFNKIKRQTKINNILDNNKNINSSSSNFLGENKSSYKIDDINNIDKNIYDNIINIDKNNEFEKGILLDNTNIRYIPKNKIELNKENNNDNLGINKNNKLDATNNLVNDINYKNYNNINNQNNMFNNKKNESEESSDNLSDIADEIIDTFQPNLIENDKNLIPNLNKEVEINSQKISLKNNNINNNKFTNNNVNNTRKNGSFQHSLIEQKELIKNINNLNIKKSFIIINNDKNNTDNHIKTFKDISNNNLNINNINNNLLKKIPIEKKK